MELLNEKLKEVRIQNMLTQSDVAKLLKIPQSAISQYESGARKPKIETLNKLAEIYGVPPAYLMGERKVGMEEDLVREVGKTQYYRNIKDGNIQGDLFVRIPVFRLHPADCDKSDIVGYRSTEVSNLNINMGDELFYTRMDGNNMAPLILEGDHILINRNYTQSDGKMYLLHVEGEEPTYGLFRVYFMRYYLNILCDNPIYSPLRVNKRHVTIIGQMVFSGRDY